MESLHARNFYQPKPISHKKVTSAVTKTVSPSQFQWDLFIENDVIIRWLNAEKGVACETTLLAAARLATDATLI